MSLKILFVILYSGALISFIDGARKKSTQVRFINITTNFNPKISKNLEFFITPDTKGRSFDFNWDLSVDIEKKLHLSIDMMVKNEQTNKYQSVFPYSFDMCRVMDGFMSQAIARTWFNSIKRYGNFSLYCPIRKGKYCLKKWQPNKGSIPPFIPNGFYVTKVGMYIDRGGYKDPVYDSIIETEVWFG